MVSINSNPAAQIALSNLNKINDSLNTLNDQISTGKKVNNAKDNASVWSIAKTLDSDISSFKATTESLSLASATVGVARTASESITDLLVEVKDFVVSAQNKSADDRVKIQADIDNLEAQISDIVDAAQFNGVNLLKGDQSIDFLSSFNRTESGVSTDTISVARNDLQVNDGGETTTVKVAGDLASGAGVTGVNIVAADIKSEATEDAALFDIAAADSISSDNADTLTVTFTDAEGNDTAITHTTTAGDSKEAALAGLQAAVQAKIDDNTLSGVSGLNVSLDADNNLVLTADFAANVSYTTAGSSTSPGDGDLGASGTATVDHNPATDDEAVFSIATDASISEGQIFRLAVTGADGNVTNVDYTAKATDTAAGDIITGLDAALTNAGLEGISDIKTTVTGDNTTLTVDFAGTANYATSIDSAVADEIKTSETAGLFDLSQLSVTTDARAGRALETIENLINTAKDASAAFGSSQRRIELQQDFAKNLVDALSNGVSTLTDTDLAEASAELQSLQVKQQLGLQSLSIANGAPQSILALFR